MAEVPLKPQAVPQGSGGSGVLMGPDTQKGLKKHKYLSLFYHKHSLDITKFISKQGPCSALGLGSCESSITQNKNMSKERTLICSLNSLSASPATMSHVHVFHLTSY